MVTAPRAALSSCLDFNRDRLGITQLCVTQVCVQNLCTSVAVEPGAAVLSTLQERRHSLSLSVFPSLEGMEPVEPHMRCVQLFPFSPVLGVEPRALYMLGKYYTIELPSQPLNLFETRSH